RVARAHPVPAIIKELTGKQSVRVVARARSGLGMLGKPASDPVPALVIDDRGMKAFMDLVLVSQPTDVDRVRQDLVEMPSADQAASGCLALAIGSCRQPDVLLVQSSLEPHDAARLEIASKET